MNAISPTRRRLLAMTATLAAAPAWAQPGAPAQPAQPAVRTRVRIETAKGVIVAELADDRAPITVANFLHYVDKRRFDGAQFYRAAKAPGDPTVGLIEGGVRDASKLFPPIAHESTTLTGLRHVDGTLSMGRFAPGTATSDFSICCGDAAYLNADPTANGDNLGYAAFGQVIEGMDVARVILALPTAAAADNPAMAGQMLDPPVAIITARRV